MTKTEKKELILAKQFEMAINSSIEMLKWLGIHVCGQSPTAEVSNDVLPTGFDISAISTTLQDEYEENREEFLKWKETKDA